MPTKQILSAAVVGVSGYVGGELLRILENHPNIKVDAVLGNNSAGQTVASLHSHLAASKCADMTVQNISTGVLNSQDVVFLAMPHGQAKSITEPISDEIMVVDCGADFRLVDGDSWNSYYGTPHAGSWPYGLPEMPNGRTQLKEARRIAVAGCYPTAVTLAMAPAFAADIVKPDVNVVAASGVSGAGRSPTQNLMASEVMGAVAAYSPIGKHRHTPEIKQNLSAVSCGNVTVSFTPLIVPMARGILATCSAPLNTQLTDEQLRSIYKSAYQDEPFIRVLPPGVWPSTASTVGSNMVHIQLGIDEVAQRVVVISAIDNLMKGAAAGAVQCVNIAFGLDETLGLTQLGVAP